MKDMFLKRPVFFYTFQLLTCFLCTWPHAVSEGHRYKCNVYTSQWPCRNNTHWPTPHLWYLQLPL